MAKKCVYCEEKRTIGDSNKTIVENNLKLNGVPIISNEVFIHGGNKLVIFANNYDTGQYYDLKTKRIKYCPMCGRKLKPIEGIQR